jgi:Domain of unknown function (DUF222)
VTAAAAPASAQEALDMVRAGLGWLAAADPTAMPAQTQAQCLLALEQLDAVETAARAWILGAFTAGQGYGADAEYSATGWLAHKARVTKGAARGHVGWARRAVSHPEVVAALAEGGALTESMARVICGWTDRLPADCRPAADAILVAAARAGADQRDLAGLAAEIYTRSQPPADDGDGFEDRGVYLETTFGGAGVIRGDLTPECSAVVTTVLDALAAPAGAEDTRTRAQRYHDGLQEAMRRLIGAGLVPDRAGQPVTALAHVSLAELRAMDAGSVLQDRWIGEYRARWAAARAAASVSGGDGAAWLDGPAARALTCDATVIPVVTGEVDPGVLDDLVGLCVTLAGHGPGCAQRQDSDPVGPEQAADPVDGQPETTQPAEGPDAANGPAGRDHRDGSPAPLTAHAREMLERQIIGKAIDLLSGPGGLASFLRRQQLGAPLAGPSLPLDVGRSAGIPAAIRRAVTLRDQHCRWPGGCDQPASACEVHHLVHRADGGPTSVRQCVLLCTFHHQVAIHRWGWQVTLHPDGTTTAWNKDRTKVLRSHSPPARAG